MEEERWCCYLLEDGTQIRMKPILTRVHRVEGQVNQKGEPLYQYEYQLVADFLPPRTEKQD